MALLVSACHLFPETYSYRYRLTVEVETPQGLRTGSSVVEVSAREGTGIPDTSIRTSTKGEAVAVDLPNGKTLFALLRTPDDDRQIYVGGAFADVLSKLPKEADWKAQFQTIAAQKHAAVVPSKYNPMFVWFRGIRDPGTVQAVKPEDFTKAFGAGTRLRRVTVQITDDPVMRGISKRFPWWEEYLNKNFDGSSSVTQPVSTNNISEQLTSLSFGLPD